MTPFGLYIHWPFCVSKCPYCDFNSHVRDHIDEARWARALCAELGNVGEKTRGRLLKSVFFGGGTPSLMSPKTVEMLLDSLEKYWTLAEDLEITLEANPNSVETQKFKDFKQAGVNRVSLGIQSLQDADLNFLGRTHGRDEALSALKIARETFDRFSFDLIYARPGQTVASWVRELKEALSYGRDHISLYQLTIEHGTAFYTAHQRKDWDLPDEETSAALYEATREVLAPAGLLPYEISNYARPGGECRHNLIYWRYQDYGAVGPGAHGRLKQGQKRWALKRLRAPETWLNAVEEQGHGTDTCVEIPTQDQITELFMMNLRLTEGLPLPRIQEVTGKKLEELIDPERLNALIEEGLLILTSESLTPTLKGQQRLNSVLSYLLKDTKSKNI